MKDLFLGIDTSNYKTSAAVIDCAGNIVWERSEYLEVPQGKRGLRQSEAFFMHSNRLPDYFREMADAADMSSVAAIGVSSRPRRVEGSYMPCFLAGINAAKETGAVLGVPVYEFSHQEGHAAAIIEDPSCMEPLAEGGCDLLFHLSGGTTEFLLCRMDENGYEMSIAGGTKDISIGQLLDRTGVAMGLPFPSGAYLDRMACEYDGRPSSVLTKIRTDNGYFNLSGAETQMLRAVESTAAEDYPALTSELFIAMGRLLLSSASELSDAYGAGRVFMAGGVSSSSYIRSYIAADNSCRARIIFGDPVFSGDNAVGTARLAKRIHENNTK